MEVLSLRDISLIPKAIDVLKEGKVIAAPTDTVYGLIADATNEKAVERVFQIKGREKEKALPVFVSSIAMAREYAKIDERQEKILQEVWPGKVTVVLESKDNLPKNLGVAETIGLRIPDYELLLKLLQKFDNPLTGTSANRSGMTSAQSVEEVRRQFQEQGMQPDLLIDAGALPPSKPSRIIDITETERKIIRE